MTLAVLLALALSAAYVAWELRRAPIAKPEEDEPMHPNADINVTVILNRPDGNYFFVWLDGQRNEMLDVAEKWADDPELSLTTGDVDCMAQRIRGEGKAEDEACRGNFNRSQHRKA